MKKEQIEVIMECIEWSRYKFLEYTFIPYIKENGDIDPEMYQRNERIREKRINELSDAESAFLKLVNKPH